MAPAPTFPSILLWLTLLGGLLTPLSGATEISLRDGRWHINGQITNPRSKAEGLLMNVRMVNATFEDRNKPEFDPEANTDAFVARIPEYVAQGINAFTFCLQGGNPEYEGAINSAFEPDGSLRPDYMRRVERVLRACDAHGVAAILTYYYQRQCKILRDEATVRAVSLLDVVFEFQQFAHGLDKGCGFGVPIPFGPLSRGFGV